MVAEFLFPNSGNNDKWTLLVMIDDSMKKTKDL